MTSSFSSRRANGGYIPPAIVRSAFRLRFDAVYDGEQPDRAGFFWREPGAFARLPEGHPHGFPASDPPPGPPRFESAFDYQQINAYLEWAYDERLSTFVDVPVRFLNPEQNPNSAGVADLSIGFKYALVDEPNHLLTFVLRSEINSGAAERGLGTDHMAIVPGLLVNRQLTERWLLEGAFEAWIPGGEEFAGEILTYGIGFGYDVLRRPGIRITPVAEFVGWSILGGQMFDGRAALADLRASAIAAGSPLPHDPLDDPGNPVFNPADANFVPLHPYIQDAYRTTIVNAKVGVRVSFPGCNAGPNADQSVYVGLGRALTGESWYEDIFRLEYRILL